MLRIRIAIEEDFSAMLDIQRRAFAEYEGTYKTSGWTTETLEDIQRDAREKKILWLNGMGNLQEQCDIGRSAVSA